MSYHHLDQYATVPSIVTDVPPVGRVLGAVMVAVGAAVLPVGAWVHLGILLVLMLCLAAVARLSARMLIGRLAGPLAFVVLASFGLVLLVPGEPGWSLGWIHVSEVGLERFGFVLGRAIVGLGAAVVLVTTTSFPELLHGLRQLRLPRVVTTALSLAYRLLYLLVDEIERVERAARSRNAGSGRARRRRLLVGVAASAVARAFARGERTHRAMLARGFRGELTTLARPHWDRRSTLCFVVLLVVVGATAMTAHLGR